MADVNKPQNKGIFFQVVIGLWISIVTIMIAVWSCIWIYDKLFPDVKTTQEIIYQQKLDSLNKEFNK